ncbi:4-alpha-glucanotransferase [Hydrogenimonas sp.]
MEATKELFGRRFGVLLHPTSLPGRYGIGSLGEPAKAWVRRLAESGVGVWQMLPLGPTGFGHSPYQCYSAFAGEPLLIDLPWLTKRGWLEEPSAGMEGFDENRVDYEAALAYKMPLLKEAFRRYRAVADAREREAFEGFCEKEAAWLEDYALFMALKHAHGGRAWSEWPEPLRLREEAALKAARKEWQERIDFEKFLQCLFHMQYYEVRNLARESGVALVGDLPIYVAYDSADVWAHRRLFELNEKGEMVRVAGVPPDYFSPTGQRWGNPLYDWRAMEAEDYAWWAVRLKKSFALFDAVRLDHFRGFVAYWAIDAKCETAVEGTWVDGPGMAFFEALEARLGDLPIIAEDLGIITPEVERLRKDLGFFGMKVLQFAFDGGAANPYLPHNHTPDMVAYTGTHDNDTTVGWFEKLDAGKKEAVSAYLGYDGPIHLAMTREAMKSVARWAVVPMQDLLGLGSWARMNTPGTESGNWCWRVTDEMIAEAPWGWVKEQAARYGR